MFPSDLAVCQRSPVQYPVYSLRETGSQRNGEITKATSPAWRKQKLFISFFHHKCSLSREEKNMCQRKKYRTESILSGQHRFSTDKNNNIKNNHQLSVVMRKPCFTTSNPSLLTVSVHDEFIRFCLCKHPFLHFLNSRFQHAECGGDSALLQQGQEPAPQQADQIHHGTAELGSVNSHLWD